MHLLLLSSGELNVVDSLAKGEGGGGGVTIREEAVFNGLEHICSASLHISSFAWRRGDKLLLLLLIRESLLDKDLPTRATKRVEVEVWFLLFLRIYSRISCFAL